MPYTFQTENAASTPTYQTENASDVSGLVVGAPIGLLLCLTRGALPFNFQTENAASSFTYQTENAA